MLWMGQLYKGKGCQLLDDLGITNQLHRTRLNKEFENVFSSPVATSISTSSTKVPLSIDYLVEKAKTITKKTNTIAFEDIYHFFMSYRQSTEKQFINTIYTGIKATVADRDFAITGKKPRIFLDIKSLADGESWETGFIDGILATMMLVCVASWHENDTGSVGQLVSLGNNDETDRCDNVLLEWELALVLLEDGHYFMKSVFPIMLGGYNDKGFSPFLFDKLSLLSSQPSLKTKTRLLEICQERGIPISELAVRRSVQDTVRSILSKQGIKIDEFGTDMIACVERIFDKGASILLSIGLHTPVKEVTVFTPKSSVTTLPPMKSASVEKMPMPPKPETPLTKGLTNFVLNPKTFSFRFRVYFHDFNNPYPMCVTTETDALECHGLGSPYGADQGCIAVYLYTASRVGPHGRGITGYQNQGWVKGPKVTPNVWHTIKVVKTTRSLSISVDDVIATASIGANITDEQFVMKEPKRIILGQGVNPDASNQLHGEIADFEILND